MAWRKKPAGREQSTEHISYLLDMPAVLAFKTLIHRTGQVVRRNRLASAAVGVLLISLSVGAAATWLVHRAKVANPRTSSDVRQVVHLPRVNYYDALNNLPGPTRISTLTSSDRHDLADVRNSVGSATEGYRPAAREFSIRRSWPQVAALARDSVAER